MGHRSPARPLREEWAVTSEPQSLAGIARDSGDKAIASTHLKSCFLV